MKWNTSKTTKIQIYLCLFNYLRYFHNSRTQTKQASQNLTTHIKTKWGTKEKLTPENQSIFTRAAEITNSRQTKRTNLRTEQRTKHAVRNNTNTSYLSDMHSSKTQRCAQAWKGLRSSKQEKDMLGHDETARRQEQDLWPHLNIGQSLDRALWSQTVTSWAQDASPPHQISEGCLPLHTMNSTPKCKKCNII